MGGDEVVTIETRQVACGTSNRWGDARPLKGSIDSLARRIKGLREEKKKHTVEGTLEPADLFTWVKVPQLHALYISTKA
jgi:hypothetical protein